MSSNRFFGVGEPLIQRQRDHGINAVKALDLIKALGCNAYRNWMDLTVVLQDPHTPDPEAVKEYTEFLNRAKELDIEITSMSGEWFLPEGCRQSQGYAMPARDLTEGSLYMQALEMLEESWCTMAGLFPQVDIWEVGNEWNLNVFLHPDGFLETPGMKPFTADEKMDVAVGEVWLAGGQSNMEFQMRYEKHLSEVKPACSNANIRFFDVPEIAYDGQLEDFDYSRMGFWRKATPEDIEYFTAVGYYFARALETDLHVPVGIVGCNWGGTTASAWMTRESVEQAGKPWMDKYRESISALDMDAYWQRQHTNLLNDRGNPFADPFSEFVMPATRSPQEIAEFFGRMKGQIESFLNDMLPQQIPGCLYEHMLMTIVPYTVRGVLWYQGESDEENGHADLYASMLTALIHDWRAAMQDAGLPFLVVQLPGWERWLESVNNDYMTVRECQQQVADTVDNVWLCSISDVGEQFDIHPKNKLTVGERLALLARGHVYGEAILCDAPRGISAAREGQEIKITFTGAEGGLEFRGDELAAMEVICDGKPVEFTASVDGEELVLTLVEECSCPADVRFAKTAWYLVNLYNKAGIPAVPFELSDELQIEE